MFYRKGITDMASQLFADLYGCNETILNSEEMIRDIARKTVSSIGAEIVEECVHKFEPIGITYFAVITTSHFSVHTWRNTAMPQWIYSRAAKKLRRK